MATLNDDGVQALLSAPNCAVISTNNGDGSTLSTVVWISLEDGELAVNSAEGRHWPTNLERDPHITALVYPDGNPYEYVEIQGTVTGTTRTPTTTSTGWPRSTRAQTPSGAISRATCGSST